MSEPSMYEAFYTPSAEELAERQVEIDHRRAEVPRDVCPVLQSLVTEMEDDGPSGLRARYLTALTDTRSHAAVEDRRMWRAGDWLLRGAAPTILVQDQLAPRAAAGLPMLRPINDLDSARVAWEQEMQLTRGLDWLLEEKDRAERDDIWYYDARSAYGESDPLALLESTHARRMGLTSAQAALRWSAHIDFGFRSMRVVLRRAVRTVALRRDRVEAANAAWEPVTRALAASHRELVAAMFAIA